MSQPDHVSRAPLQALSLVLASVEAVRNGRALYLLLATFSFTGLLLAGAQSSLARNAAVWAALQAGAAFFVAFYGTSATGLVLMDDARGLAPRDPADALLDALAIGHRLLLTLLAVAAAGLVVVGALALLFLAARLPGVGAMVFGVAVPLGVVLIGITVLALVAVAGPLAAPAVWAGLGVAATLRMLLAQLRRRFVAVVLLVGALSALSAAVGAMASFVVVSGARGVALLSVLVTGVDLPPEQFLAGVFGYGPRALSAAHAAAVQSPHGVAALVGGGVVFALALVLPGLVYLRGLCGVFLVLQSRDAA